MDDIVKAAMAKWPNVPHCYGWLALDARGQWRMRDERCQALNLPGDVIRHQTLIDFINRNYQCDDKGCWYFQNGPQRVYVDLDATPYIIRTTTNGLQIHTGKIMPSITAAYLDEMGRLILRSDKIIALVDDRDMAECINWIYVNGDIPSGDTLLNWLEEPTTLGTIQIVIDQHQIDLQKENFQTLMQEVGSLAHPTTLNHQEIK